MNAKWAGRIFHVFGLAATLGAVAVAVELVYLPMEAESARLMAECHDELAYLKEPSAFELFLNKVAWEKWRSHMKEPFGGPGAVVKYIGRYTHRVAISDSRIKTMVDDRVVFAYKKYHNDTVSPGSMTLEYDEFIRRFLLHVIPHGFKRIRHFGFLSSGSKTKALKLVRSFLSAASEKLKEAQSAFEDWLTGAEDRMKCPECKVGILEVCELIRPASLAPG